MGKVGKEGRRAPRKTARRKPVTKLTSEQVEILYQIATEHAVVFDERRVAPLVRRGFITTWRDWVTDDGLEALASARHDPVGELASVEVRNWYRRATRPSPMLDELADTVANLRREPSPCGLDDARAIERVLVAARAGAWRRAYEAARDADSGARECLLSERMYDVLCARREVEYSDETPEQVWAELRIPELRRVIADRETQLAALRKEMAALEASCSKA